MPISRRPFAHPSTSTLPSALLALGAAALGAGALGPGCAAESETHDVERIESDAHAEAALERRFPQLSTIRQACDEDPGVDVRRSLVVPNVATDPRAECTGPDPASCGPWSFGYLMAGLAQSMDHARVSEFVEDWLGTWRDDVVVNDQTIPARPLVDERLLDGWRRTHDGLLRFDDTPLKLITVVSRFDLRDDEHYGATNTAGQGRFVFGLYGRDGDGELDPSRALQFSIIFEYNVPAVGCGAKLAWAKRWRDLTDLANPTTHRQALTEITEDFAGFGVGHATLSQVRSNEVEFGALVEGTTQLFMPWELREFRLRCGHGSPGACARWDLATVTTKQSIAKHMLEPQNRNALWEWVSQYAGDIARGGEFEIPERFVDSDGVEHAFLAAFDESYANRGGMMPLTPQRDPITGQLLPYAATCRVANTTCGGCHRIFDDGCDNYDAQGRKNPLASPDLRTGFVMMSHLRPPVGAPFGVVRMSPFLAQKDLPARQRDMCEFIARECKVDARSSFITDRARAH